MSLIVGIGSKFNSSEELNVNLNQNIIGYRGWKSPYNQPTGRFFEKLLAKLSKTNW